MIKNYFKTAFRILTRNKVFSLINILGLSIALTSVLVIFLFITHEINFDRFHSNFDRIYRVNSKQIKNGVESFSSTVPVPLGTALKQELTGHDCVTQIYFRNEELLRVAQEKYMQKGLLFADTNYTKVFDVNFISGNPNDLKDPNTLFLSEELANKYFGSLNDALGEEIVIFDSIHFTVKGVFEDIPKNTHIAYKLLLSWSSLSEDVFNFSYNNWGTRLSGFATYLTIKDGGSLDQVQLLVQQIADKGNESANRNVEEMYMLQPLSKIHFDDRFDSFDDTYITSKRFLFTFISVGLIILVIAFINFTNLSIVQTIKRAKEVGIRKVLGADRIKLIKQFLGETFLLLLIAEIIALILTEIVLDKINSILGRGMELELYGSLSIISFLVIVLVLLTILSGTYPAMVLSKYNPIRALRYNMKLGRNKSFSLYNLLVIFQFLISQILIISAIVISLQIRYMQNKDLGFDKDNVILVWLPGTETSKINAFTNLLMQNPDIKSTSLGIGAPISGSNITASFWEYGVDDIDYYANIKTVDSSYYKLYNLDILAGDWYKSEQYNDSIYNIVVSKKLLEKIGIEKPIDAIDKDLRVFGNVRGRIVGVVSDFHTYSLRSEIPPVIFIPLSSYYSQLHIKTNGQSYGELKDYITQCWDKVYPEYIYDYQILEDTIQARYSSEKRTSVIIKIFTFIAIVIACLGLYGLVSFMLVQRTKEVGIRKAMGASVISLVMLVSRQFLKLVVISCIMAWPIAYYLMKNWLQNYAYKIDLHLGVFILAAILLLIITFITILYQSIKVAKTNPVNVLKYE